MTVQIGDIYKYQERKYTIIESSPDMLFNPENFGLEPHFRTTACWRGHWCEYEMSGDMLLLKNLYIFNRDGNYPPLNGIEVSPMQSEEYECHGCRKKRKSITISPYLGHCVYSGVNMPIPYTGKILLGDEFVQGIHIPVGWAYKKLIELVFDKGILLECNDLSHIAEELRKVMEAQDGHIQYLDRDTVQKLVDEGILSDYADKMWWLK